MCYKGSKSLVGSLLITPTRMDIALGDAYEMKGFVILAS